MKTATDATTRTEARHALHGDRLHRMLIADLSNAGCFRPTTARNAVYGAFILVGYAGAYATLLAGPGFAVRALALAALAFLGVHAGFLAHEGGHGAITRIATTGPAIPTCNRTFSACTGSLPRRRPVWAS